MPSPVHWEQQERGFWHRMTRCGIDTLIQKEHDASRTTDPALVTCARCARAMLGPRSPADESGVDSRFRYHLRRDGNPRAGRKVLGWVMLNPSTADDDHDDPTIRKCMRFAGRFGYEHLKVTNLFTRRATSPRDLLNLPPCLRDWPHADTDGTIAARGAAIYAIETMLGWTPDGPFGPRVDAVIAAWGANGDHYPERVAQVRALLKASGTPVYHLGLTKSGQPRHPLMLPYRTPLTRWDP